jgi:hypothetical protein
MSVNRKIIVVVLGLCAGAVIIIFASIKIGNGFKQLDESFSNDLPPTFSLPSEDSSIVSKKCLSELEVDHVYRHKFINPISVILFEKRYLLVIYKINLLSERSLKDLLFSRVEDVDRTTGKVYKVINYNNFIKLQFQNARQSPVSNIYLTLSGDSITRLVKNDSILSYHFLCHNFSVRYGNKDAIDIFAVGDDRLFGTTVRMPMDLVFLERNGAVFVLIMTPNEEHSSIDPAFLNNIIN